MRKWGSEKTFNISPTLSEHWQTPFPHPKPTLGSLLGLSLSTPRSTSKLPTIVPLAWKYHRKKTVNSLLVWWYFKFRSSSLIPLLLLTSQNLQIAAAGMLSRFYSCIQCKTRGGIYLPIARNPWKIFTNTLFSLHGELSVLSQMKSLYLSHAESGVCEMLSDAPGQPEIGISALMNLSLLVHCEHLGLWLTAIVWNLL